MKRKDSTSESRSDEAELTMRSVDELQTDMLTPPADVTDLDKPIPPSSPEQDIQTQSLTDDKGP